MSQDPLKDALDATRARLQVELDAHLAAIERQQTEAMAAARRQAHAEADERWRAEMERARSDAEAQLQAVRAAIERQQADAVTAARQQALAEAGERWRAEMERARSDADAQLQAVRAAIERQQADAVAAARQQAHAEAGERWRAEMERARSDAEAQLQTVRAALERQRVEAVTAARQQALAEAEDRWRAEMDRARDDADAQLQAVRDESDARLESVRTEADNRLQEALANAEAKAEGRLAEERQEHERVRVEAARSAGARVRDELSRAIAGLESRLQALTESSARLADDLDAERQRASALALDLQAARTALDDARVELERAHQDLHAEQASSRAAASAHAQDAARFAETQVSERQAQLARMSALLDSVRTLARARSLTDVLRGVAEAARAHASRAAVFLNRNGELRFFAADGFDDSVPATLLPVDAGALWSACTGRSTISIDQSNAPAFAALAADRAGLALPLIVGGETVALVYADNATARLPEVPAAWPEALQVLAHQASAVLGGMTALRTAQVMGAMPRGARPAQAPAGDDDQAARRYARLLVSEIKLYNEGAVRVGREKRDLLARLGPEIARARRLYEERVPGSVAARGQHFEQELRQILADGDASLLGTQTVVP